MMREFLRKLFLIDAVLLLLGVSACALWLGWHHLPGILIALVLTSANTGVAYYLAEQAQGAKMSTFMVKVMGGMGIRLGVMLVVVLLVFLFTNLPEFSFIIGLLISYICKSVHEIIFLNRIHNQSQVLGK